MESNTEIIVKFVLKKGEGDWPKIGALSDEELDLLTSIGILYLDVDGLNDVEIVAIDVMYDGITWLQELKMGMYVEEGTICGFPAPVFKFSVRGEVSTDDFLDAVGFTSVLLQPASFDETDEVPFICEDQQGYSSIISTGEALKIAEAAKVVGAVGRTGLSVEELENGVLVSDLFVIS